MTDILTLDDRRTMLANGRRSLEDPGFDPVPVVRLFAPDGPQSWLLTEIDPQNDDLAFGLCDLGTGDPEPGYVSLAWLSAAASGPLGLPIERDPHFSPGASSVLSYLTRMAAVAGRIVF